MVYFDKVHEYYNLLRQKLFYCKPILIRELSEINWYGMQGLIFALNTYLHPCCSLTHTRSNLRLVAAKKTNKKQNNPRRKGSRESRKHFSDANNVGLQYFSHGLLYKNNPISFK